MEYDWQRRWIPLDIGGVGGVKAREFRAVWQLPSGREGLSLRQLRHTPCLVLLGEPGMGKTYSVGREYKEVSARNAAISVELLGSDSVEEVRERIFGTDKFLAWKAGSHVLTIFVDSVDGSSVQADSVIAVISNGLSDVEASRLIMRLVCRDHNWSLALADQLRRHWHRGEGEDVGVYQLAKLDVAEIELAAAANGIDSESFVQQVRAANAMPLAEIPITLDMLLHADEMTDSRAKLYELGLRRLCRHSATGATVDEKRLETRQEFASRIAAVMLLCGKQTVDLDGDMALKRSSIPMRDLIRPAEVGRAESLLQETLDSALFHGSGHRQWAHPSFGEFLAAAHLSSHKIAVGEIVKLTTNREGALVPQLYDTVRWLCGMRDDFLKELAKREPAMLLGSDVSHLSSREYRRYIKQLLSVQDDYAYLKMEKAVGGTSASHPAAATELLPVLQDTELSLTKRRFVFRLLENIDMADVEDYLVELVLNEYDDPVLRHWSARRIVREGSVQSKMCLKPFIFGRQDDDEDELKGYALEALWPDHISAAELFQALTAPKRENWIGSYWGFLNDLEASLRLGVLDLPAALQWVSSLPAVRGRSSRMEGIAVEIMRLAWQFANLEVVLDAFAQAALLRIMNFRSLFRDDYLWTDGRNKLNDTERAFVDDVVARRNLVKKLLPAVNGSDVDISQLIWREPPFLDIRDLEWVLHELDNAESSKQREACAEAILRLLPNQFRAAFDTDVYAQVEMVRQASMRHSELNNLTQHYFCAVFEAPYVVEVKRNHYQEIEFHNKIRLRRRGPEPIPIIQAALDKIHDGEVLYWQDVIHGLSLESDGGQQDWSLDPNLRRFPSWKDCDDYTRIRILEAAKRFVDQQPALPPVEGESGWYRSGRVPFIEVFKYLALFMIWQLDNQHARKMLQDRWSQLSMVVLWYPLRQVHIDSDTDESDRRCQIELLQFVSRRARHSFLGALQFILQPDDSGDLAGFSALDKAEHCWDPSVENLLLRTLEDARFTSESHGRVLTTLLRQGSADAATYANGFVSQNRSNASEKDRVVEFASRLLSHCKDMDWEVIWAALTSDDEIGKLIVEKVADDEINRLGVGDRMSAGEITELMIWLEEQYPSEEDPDIDGVHIALTRELIVRWRFGIVNELRGMNDRDAYAAFERLSLRFPDLQYANYHRVELTSTVARLDWMPADPQDILSLSGQEKGRLERYGAILYQFVGRNWKWILSQVESLLYSQ